MHYGSYQVLNVEDDRVQCPYCPKTLALERENTTGDPLIHHIEQSKAHPYDQYKAVKADLRVGEMRPHPHAPNTGNDPDNDPEDGDSGTTEKGEGEPTDGSVSMDRQDSTAMQLTEDAPDSNPLLRAPLVADGGESEGCPECDGELESVKHGWKLQMRERGDSRADDEAPFGGTTDGTEEYCEDCEIIVLDDGEALDIVEVGR